MADTETQRIVWPPLADRSKHPPTVQLQEDNDNIASMAKGESAQVSDTQNATLKQSASLEKGTSVDTDEVCLQRITISGSGNASKPLCTYKGYVARLVEEQDELFIKRAEEEEKTAEKEQGLRLFNKLMCLQYYGTDPAKAPKPPKE